MVELEERCDQMQDSTEPTVTTDINNLWNLADRGDGEIEWQVTKKLEYEHEHLKLKLKTFAKERDTLYNMALDGCKRNDIASWIDSEVCLVAMGTL